MWREYYKVALETENKSFVLFGFFTFVGLLFFFFGWSGIRRRKTLSGSHKGIFKKIIRWWQLNSAIFSILREQVTAPLPTFLDKKCSTENQLNSVAIFTTYFGPYDKINLLRSLKPSCLWDRHPSYSRTPQIEITLRFWWSLKGMTHMPKVSTPLLPSTNHFLSHV